MAELIVQWCKSSMPFSLSVLSVATILITAQGFNISPQDIVQAEGINATFQCQHLGAVTIGWVFNGRGVASYSHLLANVSRNIIHGSIYVLTVLALPIYNKTEVFCAATVFPSSTDHSSGPRVEFSSTGMLTIQGPLEAATNITARAGLASISLSWKAPFSLNITNVEPNIAYCIEIYRVNITDSGRGEELLIGGKCNVFSTDFVYNSTTPDPNEHYRFVVIPRSNIFGARNGTPSESIFGAFLVHPEVCVNNITINTGATSIPGKVQLILNSQNWINTMLTIDIHEVDSIDKQSSAYCMCMLTTSASVVHCPNCSLYYFRKYSVTIQCRNAIGLSNSSSTLLNTHQLVNKNIIEVNPLPQGEILNISCSSAENVITGCLAVIISSDNGSTLPLYRMFQHRQSQASGQNINDLNISIYELRHDGNYTIFLFEGLGHPPVPVRYSAVTEKFQLTSNYIQLMRQEFIIKSSVLKLVVITTKTNRLVISSVFYRNAQGFVVIYHQCIENNENLAVSSIHVSLVRNKTVTAIDVNAGCYHVAVFGVTAEYSCEESPASVARVKVPDQDETSTAVEDVKKCTVNYIFTSLFAISTFAVLLLSIWITCQYVRQACAHRKRKPKDIRLQKCEAYEVVTIKGQ